MGFSLTSAMVAEFASKPFIQRALANPMKPTSVLSFYLGVDYECDANDEISERNFLDTMRKGDYVFEMLPFWFGGHEDYDKLCEPFSSVIRSVARENFPSQDDNPQDHDDDCMDHNNDDLWNSSIDGKMAQLVLCDQLSRNCFRGKDEAFMYDDYSFAVSRDLIQIALSPPPANEEQVEEDKYAKNDPPLETLKGELYTPYATFLSLSMMHSEELQDHERGLQILDWAEQHIRASSLLKEKQWWGNQRKFLLEHKAVIDEFGRYPHRNSKKGRESTAAELKWLSSDDIPVWAKSQG
mmetsp:Transcript_16827/g.20194  ORF Transcript_16827/g.20194 Transcript_16827/m.20194 type:complete len:296 (+) Transcript_16827:72-959(+)|eukprot:CAMPEP_0195264762 /NCGR_PEP_ID=MMETSP0706-20130129/11040_1 /TAXON_ID=33640 /ORGANISM="Asterionellopsis glacialis, Strain CCMP134" /LENGTH=295 /DNA_ID=CAMNT_0040319089 /DNA_START=67 /DNA_END=954 /DNA_ORIENTATION=-